MQSLLHTERIYAGFERGTARENMILALNRAGFAANDSNFQKYRNRIVKYHAPDSQNPYWRITIRLRSTI